MLLKNKMVKFFVMITFSFVYLFDDGNAFDLKQTIKLDCGPSEENWGTSLLYSSASDTVVAACENKTFLLSSERPAILKTFNFSGHNGKLNPSGTKLLNTAYSETRLGLTLQELDLKTEKIRALFKAGKKRFGSFRFEARDFAYLDRSNRIIFTATMDPYIYRLTNKIFHTKTDFIRAKGNVYSIEIAPDLRNLIIESEFGNLSVMNLSTFKEILLEDDIYRGMSLKRISIDSSKVLYAITDGRNYNDIVLADLSSFKKECRVKTKNATSLAIHPNNSLFAVGHDNGLIEVYDAKTCQLTSSSVIEPLDGTPIESIQYIGNEKMLWVASQGSIYVMDP